MIMIKLLCIKGCYSPINESIRTLESKSVKFTSSRKPNNTIMSSSQLSQRILKDIGKFSLRLCLLTGLKSK